MCMFVHCLTVLQVDVQFMECIVLLCTVWYLAYTFCVVYCMCSCVLSVPSRICAFVCVPACVRACDVQQRKACS